MGKLCVRFIASLVVIFSITFLFENSTIKASELTTDIQLKEQTKEKLKNTKLYKTPTELGTTKVEVAKKAQSKYSKEMKLVEEYFAEKNINISTNLNDTAYLDMVLSLAGSIEEFEENDRKLIVEYVKFIDRFENFDKNKRINELKLKTNTLTDEEIEEVNELLPIVKPIKENISQMDTIQPMTVFSNGYDNIKARDYAYKWTSNSENLRNNNAYPYYSRENSCFDCWNDCTNFVSQAIKAGGIKERGKSTYLFASNKNWYYTDYKPSYSWGGAQNFYLHFKDRTTVTQSIPHLQTGDVVAADTDDDGDIEHLALITKNLGSNSDQKLLTQHTEDRKEETSIATWLYTYDYLVYGLEMDKASN